MNNRRFETKLIQQQNQYIQQLDYCRTHFADPEYGKWYGYLYRDGLLTMPNTKGSAFKGPFRMPRSMILADTMITEFFAK